MYNEAHRKEYVLNEQGMLYQGVHKHITSRPWHFGQVNITLWDLFRTCRTQQWFKRWRWQSVARLILPFCSTGASQDLHKYLAYYRIVWVFLVPIQTMLRSQYFNIQLKKKSTIRSLEQRDLIAQWWGTGHSPRKPRLCLIQNLCLPHHRECPNHWAI